MQDVRTGEGPYSAPGIHFTHVLRCHETPAVVHPPLHTCSNAHKHKELLYAALSAAFFPGEVIT